MILSALRQTSTRSTGTGGLSLLCKCNSSKQLLPCTPAVLLPVAAALLLLLPLLLVLRVASVSGTAAAAAVVAVEAAVLLLAAAVLLLAATAVLLVLLLVLLLVHSAPMSPQEAVGVRARSFQGSSCSKQTVATMMGSAQCTMSACTATRKRCKIS
jgi:hypothetical protein